MQKVDPATPPLATYFVRVQVVNEDGPRFQQVKVRAKDGLHLSDELCELAKLEAKKLGFIPTGLADAS